MRGLRILLVASDAFIQGTIEQVLHDALGLQVVKRDKFAPGDSLYSDTGTPPALLIADAIDPATGAKSLMRKVKQDGGTFKMPVVILAPPGGNRLAFECLQLGANAVLETPVSTDELVGTIWWLLRERLFNYLSSGEAPGSYDGTPITSILENPGVPTLSFPTPAPPSPTPTPKTEISSTPGFVNEVPSKPRVPPRARKTVDAEKDSLPPKPAAKKRPAEVEEDGPITRMKLFGCEIEDMIGSGGMATVYKARQMSLDRPVAIKVIARDLAESPEFSARFIREARVQASLSHPNIVQVYDLGSSGPLLYIVMELVEGDSLREWVEEKRLSPMHWMYVAHVLGETLSYLHSKDVIHRDVKPANILIGRNGDLKLSDFGITYRPEGTDVARLTSGKLALGTPFFMSPEQRLNPAVVTPKVDVFAASVLLHVMLVGGLTRHPLPAIHDYFRDLPPSIDASLRPGLEYDGEKRVSDIRQVTEPFIEAVRKHIKATSGHAVARRDLYSHNPFAE